MLSDQLLSISEAAREAGVNRSTVQRWIAAGLKKREAGKVRWKDVLRFRARQRTGRPHGISASEARSMGSDAQEAHSLPFRDGKRGLLRFAAMLPCLIAYHVRSGRARQLTNVLQDAATLTIPNEENRQARAAERERATQQRQREAAKNEKQVRAEVSEMERRAGAGDSAAREKLREHRIAKYVAEDAEWNGTAHGNKSAPYYREHLDEWGRLPRGVLTFEQVEHERQQSARNRKQEKERIARVIQKAGLSPSLEAVGE
jgi:hypothetical protein